MFKQIVPASSNMPSLKAADKINLIPYILAINPNLCIGGVILPPPPVPAGFSLITQKWLSYNPDILQHSVTIY